MGRVGLDHPDQAMAVAQAVVDHLEVARLEDVERHLTARQKQGARQREDRDDLGQIGKAAIDRVHRHREVHLPLACAVRPPTGGHP
jgi:hypothetical protein